MTKPLLFRDADLENAFEKIATIQGFQPYIKEIVDSIAKTEFTKVRMSEILDEYKIKDIQDIKDDTLDLLLFYIGSILADNIITEKELSNLKILKRVFKIREGDFYKLRRDKVQNALNKQFQRIYEDNIIDKKEAILKVGLQELFDLGYDQFQELSKVEIKAALERGADLNDLDAVIKLKK